MVDSKHERERRPAHEKKSRALPGMMGQSGVMRKSYEQTHDDPEVQHFKWEQQFRQVLGRGTRQERPSRTCRRMLALQLVLALVSAC